jgi:nucleoid-associated protein YgaU
MSIVSFIKEAGKKIFGLGEADEESSQSTGQVAEANANRRREIALHRAVEGLGLPVTDLSVSFAEGTATVRGRVPDQETGEKVVLVVGNTFGVARVDDRLDVETPTERARFHTVERGDTLSAIAKEYYGAASRYPEIFEANRPMLEDPDQIYPGQVLRIPGA